METEELRLSFSLLPVIAQFTLVLLFLTLTPAAGQFQVIGSSQPIVAVIGDDVILPCHVEPRFDVVDLTVEWSKPDLRPDPNDRLRRVGYVHLYRNNREVPDMKISSYTRRTELFTDRLREGNISLKITNVTHIDEGRYRCFIPKLRGRTQSSVIQLVVAQNSYIPTLTDTSLHPTYLQTPQPTEEMDLKGGLVHRTREGLLAAGFVFMIMSFGAGGYYFFLLLTKNTNSLKTTLYSENV